MTKKDSLKDIDNILGVSTSLVFYEINGINEERVILKPAEKINSVAKKTKRYCSYQILFNLNKDITKSYC